MGRVVKWTLITVSGGSKLPQPSWEQFAVKIHILKGHTLCPQATSKNLSWRNNGTDSCRYAYLDMHYIALFIMAKTDKKLNVQFKGLAKLIMVHFCHGIFCSHSYSKVDLDQWKDFDDRKKYWPGYGIVFYFAKDMHV